MSHAAYVGPKFDKYEMFDEFVFKEKGERVRIMGKGSDRGVVCWIQIKINNVPAAAAAA